MRRSRSQPDPTERLASRLLSRGRPMPDPQMTASRPRPPCMIRCFAVLVVVVVAAYLPAGEAGGEGISGAPRARQARR